MWTGYLVISRAKNIKGYDSAYARSFKPSLTSAGVLVEFTNIRR